MRALCRTAANDPQETYGGALLDHLVSHVEDSRWDRGIELLGGLELMMKEHLVALSASRRRFREGGGVQEKWRNTPCTAKLPDDSPLPVGWIGCDSAVGCGHGADRRSTSTGDQLGFTPTPNGKLILKWSSMVVGLEAPAAEVKVARGNCIPTWSYRRILVTA
jgi:hypothetical protein